MARFQNLLMQNCDIKKEAKYEVRPYDTPGSGVFSLLGIEEVGALHWRGARWVYLITGS